MSNSDNSWLSTRNKSKLPSKPVCLKKRTSLSKPKRSQQSHGTSVYNMTQSSPPPKQLFTATKQSKLNDFFRSVESRSNFEEEKETNGTDAQANPCITKRDIYDNFIICDVDSAETKKGNKTDRNICHNKEDKQNINSDQCRLSDSIQDKESLSDYCLENIQGKKNTKDYHISDDFDYCLIPNERTSPLQESSQNSINKMTEKYTKRSSGKKRLFSGEESTERSYCKRQKVLKQHYTSDIDVVKVEDDTAEPHYYDKADLHLVCKRNGNGPSCSGHTTKDREQDNGVLNVQSDTKNCEYFSYNDTCNIKIDMVSKGNDGRHTISDKHKESTSDKEHITAGFNLNSKYTRFATDEETDSNSSLSLSKEDTFDSSPNNSLSKANTLEERQNICLSKTKTLDLIQNKSLCNNDTSAYSQNNSLTKDETFGTSQNNSFTQNDTFDISQCDSLTKDYSLDISQSNSLTFDTQTLSTTKNAQVEDSFSLNLEGDTELNLGDTEEADDQSLELHTQFTL